MIDSVSFDFIVEVVIKLFEFFDPVADTVIQKFIAFRFFMSIAVYFKKRFVIGFNYIYL